MARKHDRGGFAGITVVKRLNTNPAERFRHDILARHRRLPCEIGLSAVYFDPQHQCGGRFQVQDGD